MQGEFDSRMDLKAAEIMGTCPVKAEGRWGACPSQGGTSHQQVEAFIPAELVAPADIRQARQSARAAALGILGDHCGARTGLAWTLPGLAQSSGLIYTEIFSKRSISSST